MLKLRIPTITYWFDITGIESGDEFEEKIISAINNSSYVLFAMSDYSMQSQWTKDEVMYAKNIGKKIIPVLLDGAKLTDGWFLFKFGRIDCIDSADSKQVEKMLKNLSNWTRKEFILNKENIVINDEKNNNATINNNTQDERGYYHHFNWGALAFGLIWALANRLYWTLILIIPYLFLKPYGLKSMTLWGVFNIIMSIYGNKLAFKKYKGTYKTRWRN